MQLIESLTDITTKLRGGAVSIGNFDGVHRGHAAIVGQLCSQASNIAGPAIVFTFDPHPVRLLRPEQAPPPLTWTRRKAEVLGQLGIDALVAYPTDAELLQLTAEEFFQQIIVDALDAKAVVEGPNFYFGHNRAGDVQMLARLCAAAGIDFTVVPPTIDEDELISSSRIRGLLTSGQVGPAARLLGRPYRLRGMVTHGAQRGATLGFPTANLDAIDTLIPGKGVYAGRATLGSDAYAAAINVGPNPTFGEEALKVEVHLLDFDQTIYAEPLEVDFVARLRDIRAFANPAELQEQLDQDVLAARQLCDASE